MAKVVAVPNVGNVEFPDTMSDGDISTAIRKQVGALMSPQQKAAQSTGNPVTDALAGAGAGLIGTGVGAYDMLRKIPVVGRMLPAPNDQVRALTVAPDTLAGHIGHFGEQAAEFAVPAAAVGETLKGAGLAARALGQAGVGAGVSAVQSGGDPTSTIIGAGLGGAGEVAGAAATGAKALLKAKSPTLTNFAESFGNATPTQKARLSQALPTLIKDGIAPADDVHGMADAVKGKLADLGQAYQNLDPAIRAREVDPALVVKELRGAQQQYMRRGVVTDDTSHSAIQNQIDKVLDIARANNGKLNVDDIVHLKQMANGRTTWNSPDVEKSLWNHVGDAYRTAADRLAPEITPLNRDYQKYRDLEQMVDQNIARGKGTTPSGLDLLMRRGASHAAGAAAGGAIGGAVAGPVGAAAGGIAGSIIGPKLGKAAAQAVQNAVDSGAFQSFAPVRQGAIRAAAKIGDNAAVLKLLGQSAAEESAVSGTR